MWVFSSTISTELLRNGFWDIWLYHQVHPSHHWCMLDKTRGVRTHLGIFSVLSLMSTLNLYKYLVCDWRCITSPREYNYTQVRLVSDHFIHNYEQHFNFFNSGVMSSNSMLDICSDRTKEQWNRPVFGCEWLPLIVRLD